MVATRSEKIIKDIHPEDLHVMIQEYHSNNNEEIIVIDVREPSEYSEWHIQGSINLPLGELTKHHPKLIEHADKRWIFHCKTGRRSRIGCQQLVAEGIEKEMFDLLGGLEKWVATGMPVVAEAKKDNHQVMSLERQMHLISAVLVILSMTLGLLVSPLFFIIQVAMAAGWLSSGLFNLCFMRMLLTRLPWNKT